MKIYLFLLSFIILSSSCHQKKKTNVPTLKTTPEFVDFHRQFYHSNTEGFSKLKKKYPYLFPHETPDSIWHQKQINRWKSRQCFWKFYTGTKKIDKAICKHSTQLSELPSTKNIHFNYQLGLRASCNLCRFTLIFIFRHVFG